MKVFIEKENKNIEIDFQGTVKNLLLDLKINPETVIVVCNDELVLLDEKLSDFDSVKLLSVVSGG
ncbi:MoaD/ThiS family protein [Candidatus Woesearchaeota archaeon]|jgi:sulfur carrier protein|nr:MoaD/ThiS family protein [Candidatus Woesearchaeota archaeon]